MDGPVLVTGSSGTIGTLLVEKLLDRNEEVVGIDNRPNQWSKEVDDISITADLASGFFHDKIPEDIDTIVHLAANARVHDLVREPEDAHENVYSTFNIFEYARQHDVENVIFSSSREVYGNYSGKLLYTEEDTYIDKCESPYTASKVAGEAMLKAYSECYGIDMSIMRFSNVYGKYDVSDRVVPLFLALASEDRDLTVYGDDKVLDFTHISDCVSGILKIMFNFHKAKGTTFNIASGEGNSLIELAEVITDTLDSDSSIHVEENRTGEVSRYVADISKARQILGYEPQFDLREGVAETAKWYQNNVDLNEEIPI